MIIFLPFPVSSSHNDLNVDTKCVPEYAYCDD